MDYDALAKQFGGVAAAPAAPPSGEVDYDALAKQFGGGRSIDLADVPGQALMNAPASAAKFAGNIVTAVTNPVQTVTGLADLAAGGLRAGAKAVLPEKVFQFIDSIDNPETTKRISETANAVGGQLAEDYGSWDGIKRKAATDPVALVSDMSTLLTGGSLLARGAQMPGVAGKLNTAATMTDPLALTIKGVGAAGSAGVNAARSVPGMVMGIVPRALEPFTNPRGVVVNKLAGLVDPTEAVNALRATQNMEVTPGAPKPSFTERLVAGGVNNPGVADMQAGLRNASPAAAKDVFAFEQQRVGAIQAQIARIDEQVQNTATALTPDQTAKLKTVRDSLMQNLAEEQAQLAARSTRTAQVLPDVDQAAPGQAIQARAAGMARETRANVVEPAYEAAYNAAGDGRINISAPVRRAQEIMGRTLSTMDASTVPEPIRRLLSYETGPRPGEYIELIPGAGYTGPPRAPAVPEVSLRDLGDIRQALNTEWRAAKGSSAPDAATRAHNLKTLIDEVDGSIRRSNGIPDNAKTLFTDALGVYSEKFAPRFRSGETGDMFRYTSQNRPVLAPSETVPAYLKTPEGAQQFVRSFETDPSAVNSMRVGVLGWLRDAAVDKTTGFLDPAKLDQFIKQHGRQIETLDGGSNTRLRPFIDTLRDEARTAKTNLDALASDAARMKKPQDAAGLVDQALKSSVEMDFIKQKLSPPAREALAAELRNRALTSIKEGNPEAALKYLTDNAKAIKTGLGKGTAYDDLVGLARFQKDLADVAKQAPKTDIPSVVTLQKTFTPAQLTDLKVVADDLKRMRQADELAAGTNVERASAKMLATQDAQSIGVSAKDAPAFFTPVYTAIRNTIKKVEERVNRKAIAEAVDLLYRDPDKLIPLLEKAAQAKTPRASPPSSPRTLTIPAMRGAPLASAGAVNSMSSQENRNAMAR